MSVCDSKHSKRVHLHESFVKQTNDKLQFNSNNNLILKIVDVRHIIKSIVIFTPILVSMERYSFLGISYIVPTYIYLISNLAPT